MFIQDNSNVMVHVNMKYNKLKHIVLMIVVKDIIQFQKQDNIVYQDVIKQLVIDILKVHNVHFNVQENMLNHLMVLYVVIHVNINRNMNIKFVFLIVQVINTQF